MPIFQSAGLEETEFRRHQITRANGAVADLTGIEVTLFKRVRGADDWTDALTLNTADDPSKLVIIDAETGLIEIRPVITWWTPVGFYELCYEVLSTPPFFAYRIDVMSIEVVTRPI